MKSSRYVGLLTVLLCAAMSIMGCKKATGGGTLRGLANQGRITFGMQMRCENTGPDGSAYLTGQFQYKDHDNNVAFHAVVDNSLALFTDGEFTGTCEDLDVSLAEQGLEGIFGIFGGIVGGTFPIGTYTPQPKNLGVGGKIEILVADAIPSNILLPCDEGQDQIIVHLIDGVYDGYIDGGCVGKGNITVFTE